MSCRRRRQVGHDSEVVAGPDTADRLVEDEHAVLHRERGAALVATHEYVVDPARRIGTLVALCHQRIQGREGVPAPFDRPAAHNRSAVGVADQTLRLIRNVMIRAEQLGEGAALLRPEDLLERDEVGLEGAQPRFQDPASGVPVTADSPEVEREDT